MSVEQLSKEALALPVADRIALAQMLWASLEESPAEPDGQSAMVEALRRDAELTAGITAGRTHAEVMAAARRAIA